jgi:hypothetical protein
MRLPDHPLVKEQTSKSDSALFSGVSELSLLSQPTLLIRRKYQGVTLSYFRDSAFLRLTELASLGAKTGEFIKLSQTVKAGFRSCFDRVSLPVQPAPESLATNLGLFSNRLARSSARGNCRASAGCVKSTTSHRVSVSFSPISPPAGHAKVRLLSLMLTDQAQTVSLSRSTNALTH